MTEDPEEIYRRYAAAAAAFDRGDIAAARREFELLLFDAPRFAPAWDGLAGCFDVEGELERAGECYRKAMRLDRKNWRSRYNWGVALQRAGDAAQATRWLREASRLAPGERRIYQRLGLGCFEQGEYEEARRWYLRALGAPEAGVRDAELYVEIGRAESELGNWDAAEAAYERACLLAPEDARVYHAWAAAAARAGRLEEAARLAARARAIEPRAPQHLRLQLELALDRADWDGARRFITELRAVSGCAEVAAALEGELERRLGNAETARRRVLSVLSEGAGSHEAVDLALRTLRSLRNRTGEWQGFRLVLESLHGGRSYFRPYVVLAEDDEEAVAYAGDLQNALDPAPWRLVEVERFDSAGEMAAGVHQVSLTRAFLPREDAYADLHAGRDAQ